MKALSIHNSTWVLLRFHFSMFLLPVTLFSLYYVNASPSYETFLVLVIWHLLVFPSSNGYNSWNDRDTGPIGGLSSPPVPDHSLLITCNLMDLLSVLLAMMINLRFGMMVLFYIMASRLYSNRTTRLKKFPLTGFAVVFFFQGFWVFIANVMVLSGQPLTLPVLIAALACSFFIGALYPVTQIYQHEADAADGVTSLSMLLGKKATFVFAAIMFTGATACLYYVFMKTNVPGNFILFNLMMFPSVLFFLVWSIRAFLNRAKIDFRNSMILLALSSMMINLYFIILLLK